MKTIVVTGIGDTRNNGCWAMVASAMASIREASPVPVKFVILSRKGSHDAERLQFDDTEFVPWPWSLITLPRMRLIGFLISAFIVILQALCFRFSKRNFLFPSYWRSMHDADLVLDLSGDSISSAYSWIANLASIFPLLIAWMIDKPYYLCAQSIGPFEHSPVDRLAVTLLRAATLITVREDRTMEILQQLGITANVRRTQDLAFLLVPSDEQEHHRLAHHEDVNPAEPWIGVSVSSIIAGYAFKDLPPSQREDAYLTSLANFCDEVYQRSGFRTLFVPHVTIPNAIDDDLTVTDRVKGKMRHGETCRIIRGNYTGSQLKAMIGMCQFFLGSRMHATIGALSQGIPTVTLVYNHKTLGINGDVLGQHDYLVDIRSVSSADFTRRLNECFARLMDNAAAVRSHLASELPRIREGARENALLAVNFLEVAGPLQNMDDFRHCTGCGTCAGSCPQRVLKMRETPEGTLRPGLTGNCTGCRHCDHVCPGLGLDLATAQSSHFGVSIDSSALGACLSCRIGHATDHDVRFNGSSGGLVTAACSYLLDTGRVDAVLVIEADRDNPFLQRTRWARTAAELRSAQGARYLPAAVNTAFAEIPSDANRLAVVGLPCHLWGLHLLEETGQLSGRRIEWRFGLFCGRTPSLRAADTMLAGLGLTREQAVEMRFRGEGWPGFSAISTQERTWRMPLEQMWEFIGSPFFTTPHCFSCPDFFGYLSDISFGDAWLPECSADQVGTNLMLIRSQRAADLVSDLERAGIAECREVSAQQVETAFRPNIRRKQGYSAVKSEVSGARYPVVCGTPMGGGTRVRMSYRLEWFMGRLGASPVLRGALLRYPAGKAMRLLRRCAAVLQRGR